RLLPQSRCDAVSIWTWGQLQIGNKRRPRSKTGAATASIDGHGLVDQHPVVLAADLDCVGGDTRRAWRRKHHALAGGEDGLETHRRPGLTLREGGDDPETVALDGVVGDAGDVTEVDALALDRPELVCVRRADGGQGERGGEDGAMDAHCFSPAVTPGPASVVALAPTDGP